MSNTRHFIVYISENGKPQIDELPSGPLAWDGARLLSTQPLSVTVLTFVDGLLFPDGTIVPGDPEPVAWVDSKLLDRPLFTTRGA